MEIFYSQTRHPEAIGRKVINPRFFTTPEPDASAVFIVGDWPRIVSAYEALKVPVRRLDAPPQLTSRATALRAPAPVLPTVPADERDAIYIPDDWRDLPWSRPAEGRDLTLRGLAAMFSAAPVINKAQALEAIEAELRRRRGEEEGPNGLTRREMNADLEGAGIEPDPVLSVDELAERHAEVKGREEG